jgi:quinol monooxygenase YgiN
MVIVAGFLRVDPDARGQYLRECTEVIRAAREAAGCIDFHLSADPIEPGRINIFEQWESIAAVEAFRGSGPSGDQQAAVLDAQVTQYEVANSTSLT